MTIEKTNTPNNIIDSMKSALNTYDQHLAGKAETISKKILKKGLEEIYKHTGCYAASRMLFICFNIITGEYDAYDYNFSSTSADFHNGLNEFKPMPVDTTISGINGYLATMLAKAFQENGCSPYVFETVDSEKLLVIGINLGE